MNIQMLFAAGVVSALAGCGGGGSDGRLPSDLLNERVLTSATLATRVDALPGTQFSALPATGAATFRGVGALTVDRTSKIHPNGLSMIGDATMTANFGTGRVTGKVDNFQGVEAGAQKPLTGYAANGSIAIGGKSSQIVAKNSNKFTTDYAGQVNVAGTGDLNIAGNLDGRFVGTRASAAGTPRAVLGLTASDDGLVATQGSRRSGGSLDIYAEQK